MDTAKQTILDLLRTGHEFAELANDEDNVHVAEKAARRAIGYFNAANVLLTAFGELHNELIEQPQFVAARKFNRKWVF